MKLIDTSYFTRAPYIIANASATPTSLMEKACDKVITDIVEQTQRKFLVMVLGCKDGNEICDAIENAESYEEVTDEVKAICGTLRTPFLSYVYFYILRYSQSVSGITGVYQLVSSDKSISPRFRQAEAWNSMALTLRAIVLEKGWKCCKKTLLETVNQFNI